MPICSETDLSRLRIDRGAMNTGHAAVAYRTRPVGTLRALGFSRFRIVTAFLAESIALAVVGGIIGSALALPVHGLSTGMTNFSSFSALHSNSESPRC
jgi:putative ABC transport system permease protein